MDMEILRMLEAWATQIFTRLPPTSVYVSD